MTSRLHRGLMTFVCAVLVAAACGGEVSDSDTSGDSTATPASVAPDSSEAQSGGSGGSDEGTPGEGAQEAETSSAAADEPTTTLEESSAGEAENGNAAADAEAQAVPRDIPNIFDDPRDGLFDEFQATMDRGDHPFMQVDEFCTAHDPAPERVSTDRGIEADSISVVHIRQTLENLVQIGFASDVGDPREMGETFVAYVNEQCGGVRGRKIDLHTIEVDVLGDQVQELQIAACIEATEDRKAVIVLNTTGILEAAALCIVDQQQTALILNTSMPDLLMERGEGRLISSTNSAEQALRTLALDLIESGELEGKTVGVAASDAPGRYEAVETGLVDVLRANGVNVAVFDKLGCTGVPCMVGSVETVGRMLSAGVDVFFNVLNILTAPPFLNEMANQGFKPGDVQFYATTFNNQANELVSSKIVQFGGASVGELYNGAVVLDSRDIGGYRLEDYEPKAFNEMCAETYANYSPSRTRHSIESAPGEASVPYGMVTNMCSFMRMALRAIYDAGDNPTVDDVQSALLNLGAVDSNEMLPTSIRPDKTTTPDVIRTFQWEFPCTRDYEFAVPGSPDGICIYPTSEFRPIS